MVRSIGAFLLGAVGIIVSAFASALGLSVHTQRIFFWLGVALVVIGAAFFTRHWRAERKRLSSPPAPTGYSTVTTGRGRTTIRKSRMSKPTYTEDEGRTEIHDSDLP